MDPVACAEMRIGPAQVDVAALTELNGLVTAVTASSNSQRDDGVAWEEVDEQARHVRTGLRQTDEPDLRAPQGGRDERGGKGESCNHACSNPDAGRRPRRRGARR